MEKQGQDNYALHRDNKQKVWKHEHATKYNIGFSMDGNWYYRNQHLLCNRRVWSHVTVDVEKR